MKQIIAMGGGGFLMEPRNPLLDQYILDASDADTPTVCYLPTAGGDSVAGIAQFYASFNNFDCRPYHLSLFREPFRAAELIQGSDIVYVGGGNTRLMLRIWQCYGIEQLLRKAWESGTILCGVSAGAICWFEQGSTDSDGGLRPLDCLGFLSGSCSPHYDGEPERRPEYHRFLKEGSIINGLALDDGAAAHYCDGGIKELVSSRPAAAAYAVTCDHGTVVEKALPVRYLGSSVNPLTIES